MRARLGAQRLLALSGATGWVRSDGCYLAIVGLVTLLAGLPLLQLKLMLGHDYRGYLPRHVEFYDALTTGHLVPRWAPDFSGGYGEPFFNFNPPMIYAVTAAFHALGFSFVAAENLACLALLLLAGIGMYLLAREFFGPRGGVVSAAAYVFAPYVSAKLYVNHALADYSAFAFVPLALWGLYRFAEGGRPRFFLVGALAVALLLLSSNPVSLITFPALGLLLVLLAWTTRSPRVAIRGAWCLAVGTGLAAYFWLPALAERDFVHLRLLLDPNVNYHHHFAEASQLLDPAWGGRLARPERTDGTSFAIGPAHLVMVGAALVLIRRIWAASARSGLMVALFVTLVAYGAFLSISQSLFIWDRLPLVQYLTYSWRFLSIVAVGTGFLFGFPFLLVPAGRRWLANGLVAALLATILIFNLPHASPAGFSDETDAAFTPLARPPARLLQVRQYEPIWVKERPPDRFPAAAQLSGDGQLAVVKRTPTISEFRVEAAEAVRLRINTFYFPGWIAYVNGRERPIDHSNPQGVMELQLERGIHDVQLRFEDTPVRLWATRLSLLALVLLGLSLRWPALAPRLAAVAVRLPAVAKRQHSP